MTKLENGELIGAYRVIRTIGEGGMATVYEVEHTILGVHYALKTFTFDPKDDEDNMLRTKFVEEGNILARVKHPKIVHVFDLAFDEKRNLLYFVMDLVLYEGEQPYSVDDVSREDLDEEWIYTWFVDVCEALDHIHSLGIVHRDIKAANLLLNNERHAVLADFGINHIFGESKVSKEIRPSSTQRVDGSVTILGSPHLMAPEVEQGGEVTPAADAYSLGSMIFELLTGEWYDECKDPHAALAKKKYDWISALALLLDENPAERPENYSELARMLAEDRVKRDATRKRLAATRRWALIGLLAMAALSPFYFVFTGLKTLDKVEEKIKISRADGFREAFLGRDRKYVFVAEKCTDRESLNRALAAECDFIIYDLTEENQLTLEEVLSLVNGNAIVIIERFDRDARRILTTIDRLNAWKNIMLKSWHGPKDVEGKLDAESLKNLASGKLIYIPQLNVNLDESVKRYEEWSARKLPPSAYELRFAQEKPAFVLNRLGVHQHEGAPRIWLDSINGSFNAGYIGSDGWEWLLSRGATVITTDRPAALVKFLKAKGRR